MCLRWFLCSGVLSGLMFGSLMGSVSSAAETNSPTGVVHRLIAVDYLLMQDDGTWRVHDIKLDGVSLATNFRLQFNKVIAQHSYAELLRRLQAKLRYYLAQTTH